MNNQIPFKLQHSQKMKGNHHNDESLTNDSNFQCYPLYITIGQEIFAMLGGLLGLCDQLSSHQSHSYHVYNNIHETPNQIAFDKGEIGVGLR